jgi:hypothetical protein
MPKQIIRFKCNYCKKTYAGKSAANKHECLCFHNEAVKSCVTCNRADIKEVRDSEGDVEDSFGYCFRLNKQIFCKGSVVRNCWGWEAIKYEEHEGEDI